MTVRVPDLDLTADAVALTVQLVDIESVSKNEQAIADAGVSLLVSIPAGFLVGGVLGLVLEAVLLRRMYHRPLDTLLVTFGVALVLLLAVAVGVTTRRAAEALTVVGVSVLPWAAASAQLLAR